MQEQRELNPVVVDFINRWINTVQENPHIVLGEWLYAFGAMAGLAMKSQELDRDQAIGAVNYMTKAAALVYSNVNGKAMIQ